MPNQTKVKRIQMTKKITSKKVSKSAPQTLHLFPTSGFMGLITDAVLVFTLVTIAFTLLLTCISMAEKITITVGK